MIKCSNCQREIEDEFYFVQENHVINVLFNDVENCFCSSECICDFIMVDSGYLSLGDKTDVLEELENE